MNRFMIYVAAASMLMACQACRTEYNPEKCDTLITAIGKAGTMQDVTKAQWRDAYSQFMALDAKLHEQITTLVNTRWSDEKEKAVNELLASQEISQWRTLAKMLSPLGNSGFSPSQYFSDKEVTAMKDATEATMREMDNLLAQADLDGK